MESGEKDWFEFIQPVLGSPVRTKIVMILSRSQTPLSFAEILQQFGKEKIKNYNLIFHLRVLEKKGFVINERKLDLTSGRPRTSFFSLTDKGKKAAKILEKILQIL